MSKQKNIQFLSNEPCREDAFEGHSHKNIAKQVAIIIKEDENRYIIGLEGGWGSGKSNLISLINKDLNGDNVYDKDYDHKNSEYPFFIYDAWGHQADYQRRAILEELTDDLIYKKQILDENKWKKKLGELLAKRRKTTTKEVPRLGIGLIMSIILTVLTPLVVFVVGLVPAELWWLKVLVSVFPYLVGIWYAIHDRKNSLKKNGQECTLKNILSELILVYKDQIKENETYTTISEKEPSSVEFKSWMDEVDKDLTCRNKTLIIVFDNMDRLPSQKVESLWSSIHSFFSDKTYDNIKVLIPFDREHVKQAFKNEDAGGESFGNDFINKTFDVVFRVPPPIMSGWQQYMQDLWGKAFGDDVELSISVIQIYDALCKNHTPRKIIAFINEVATVKMTMRDDIPDRYIALFIFGKEYIEKDPINRLLNPDYMGDVQFEYAKDPDTIKYLSALYYQLPVDQALDIVFTREATEALNSGNAERLHEMMEHINLSTILGKAILKVTDKEKASKTLAALDAYYEYGDFDNMPKWLAKIWNDLYQKCKNDGVKWDEIKPFHTELFTHLYDEKLGEELIKEYLSIEDSKLDAKLYVDTINKLKSNNDIIDRMLEKYHRKVSPKLFLELLKYTEDDYESYGIYYEVKELDKYLASLGQNEVLLLDVIPNIIFSEKETLNAYISKLQAWINDSANIEASVVEKLFTRLKEVSNKPITFAHFFNDNIICTKWNEIKDGKNTFKYDLLAMRIARRNEMNATYSSYFKDTLDSCEENDVAELAKVIEYYVDYDSLVLSSDYYKDLPLVVAVFDYLTKNNRGGSKANILDCLYHFDKTIDDYGIDKDSFFDRLNGWQKFLEVEKVNVEKIPSGLLALVIENENKTAQKIRTAIETYFSSLSQDQWKTHILKKDNVYRIWKIYHPQKYQDNFDALKALLKDYASGAESNQPDKNLIDEWLTICLEVKHSVKGLFNEVSGILKKDSSITKEKLIFFGAWMLKYTDIDKQKDFVEKLIPTEIIDAPVMKFIAEHINILKNCDIPEEFTDKIKHMAETSMAGQETVKIVCETLGIQLELPQDEKPNGE